jgi:hypothetical protein
MTELIVSFRDVANARKIFEGKLMSVHALKACVGVEILLH